MGNKKNIVVVDGEDNLIDNKPREIVDKEKLRYRVTALWLKNSKGESLLARRAYTKTHYPGIWGPAVTGTVDEGESYEQNMVKEAEEELGLKNIKLKKGPYIKINGQYNHFTQWFVLKIDKPVKELKISEEEVVEVKWFSEKELKKELKDNPKEFVKNMKRYVELFYWSGDNF